MAMTAPIPPDEDGERLGVADGHDKDYGRFLVASGPYMFEGSENLDFSLPAGDQKPVAGYVPNRSIVLVRNPSWSPDSDELRPAYPDRIEVTIGGDNDVLYDQVATGELDFVVDGAVPPEKIQEYTTNPELQDRFHRFPSDVVRYISMNLALPPFDDLHVRKAFNYALNKAGMRQVRGGPDTGIFAGHIMVDSLQNNLLAEYDPYATPNSEGDLDLAAAEMAMSKYDSNGDGVCDDPSCKDILSVTDREDPYPDQTAIIRENLEPLGITLDVKDLERGTMYNKCLDLNEKVPLCLGPGWGKDYADGYTFGPPLFGSEAIFPSCCNYALVGASPETLAEAGYDITEVPSVDPDMAECAAQTEPDARFQCWADVDKKLMEEVVPWVPYLFDNALDIVSDRIVNYSFDQFAGLAAFDQMAIDPALQ
jgi:peptide/nickel transport system substrate-binding protein